MIWIDRPYIVQEKLKSRCCCDIIVDDKKHSVWFEVEKQYEKYLVTERSDAFLIGLLRYAIIGQHDISCVSPVTDELLYNVSVILIPTLVKTINGLHCIKIMASSAPPLGGG